jgi:hypothetical protein
MTTVLDRIVRWNLDYDGDLYGDDERERLRWYEGIATAAQMQWVAIPWVAAILVWVGGRPTVVPLLVILAVLVLPMGLCTLYVRSRRVDTTPRTWSAKRLLLAALGSLPFVVFMIGADYQLRHTGLPSLILGAAVGLMLGIGITAVKVRRRRRLEAVAIADED